MSDARPRRALRRFLLRRRRLRDRLRHLPPGARRRVRQLGRLRQRREQHGRPRPRPDAAPVDVDGHGSRPLDPADLDELRAQLRARRAQPARLSPPQSAAARGQRRRSSTSSPAGCCAPPGPRAPSRPCPSGRRFAALLFAVHPLRVESVVWVTERKDVLCGFFFMLAVLAYLRAAEGGDAPAGLDVRIARRHRGRAPVEGGRDAAARRAPAPRRLPAPARAGPRLAALPRREAPVGRGRGRRRPSSPSGWCSRAPG